MKTKITSTLLFFCAYLLMQAQNTKHIYLSGTGADQTVEWDFFCSGGAKSGKWLKIAVPSCWEQEGFGSYNYGHDEERLNETGLYRYDFEVPKAWKGQEITIVFDGVMTDALVKINGQEAGPLHQGAFYQFKYDISSLLNYGKTNQLEVFVKKNSDNESVELAERKADFWIFGGIFRPVFLEVKPSANIQRVAIDAKASGEFSSKIYISNPKEVKRLSVEIATALGESQIVFEQNKIEEETHIHGLVNQPKLWTAETPHLYAVTYRLYDKKDKLIHQHHEKVGFRTVEVRPNDGIYVNGQRMKFKGVNRHSFHSTYGRTSSKALSIETANLIKDMNMNAVRMSHYPPDAHFLDVCDSLGLYVLNELAAWQKPAYDNVVGEKLLKEMIFHDQNHPSIVIWCNGNEGGFNHHLDTLYAVHDIQQRHVIHPWQDYDGINTLHYISYDYLSLDGYSKRSIFMPTEFLHGLYDGGHGAGLEDYWLRMWNDPLCAGGFLWNLADEAIERRDKNNQLDTDGNHGADGILGPYHKKEASFYTIKEIWSPLHFEKRYITADFNGQFRIENRYDFTNLYACKIKAEWLALSSPHEEISERIISAEDITIDLAPLSKGILQVNLCEELKSCDLLRISLSDPYGRALNTWTWPVKTAKETCQDILPKAIENTPSYNKVNDMIIVKTDHLQLEFSGIDGQLKAVYKDQEMIPLANGPLFINHPQKVENIEAKTIDNKVVISTRFKNNDTFVWEVNHLGLVELKLAYTPSKQASCTGISFTYPKEKMEGIKWRGDGPWRVYKNRMKGVSHGVWEKTMNHSITGISDFQYPEFQGYHANTYWAVIKGKTTSNFAVYINSDDIFLKLYGEDFPQIWGRDMHVYPNGDIAFLHAINAMGTKFKSAKDLGPQSRNGSQQFVAKKYYGERLKMHLLFDFNVE